MKRAITVLSLAAACSAASAIAQNSPGQGPIKHVLLISVDGMHAADFANCAKGISTVNDGDPYCPALAALGKTGVNYVAASTCTPFATPTGTRTEYEEGIDIDQTKLNGGAPGASLTDGGLNSIDSTRLIRDPNNGCNPVFPWAFVRANSIFS